MKKNALVLLFLVCISNVFGQAYYPQHHALGDLPGSSNLFWMHQDMDDAGAKEGWKNVLDSAKTDRYSKVIFIPFYFEFAGVQAQAFKVSSTGFLTFDTTVSGTPSSAAEKLPSSKLPNKTIAVWGINGRGSNDQVLTKTFGISPRLFCVKFSSYSTPGDTSGAWNYVSIVFEELTNKIYVVSMNHQNAFGNFVFPKIFAGVQENNTTGIDFSITNENNFPITNKANDNVYTEIIRGNALSNDLKAGLLTANNYVKAADSIFFQFTAFNLGKDSLDSLIICSRVNGGAIKKNKITGMKPKIEPSGYGTIYFNGFVLASAIAGSNNFLEVWAQEPNGIEDQNHLNDTLKLNVLSVNGNSGFRKTLIESSTAAWCGDCPPVDFTLNELKTRFEDSIIIVKHHVADEMKGNGDSLVLGYYGSVKNIAINREISKKNRLTITNPTLLNEAKVSSTIRKGAYSPLNINVLNVKLDTISKKFTFDVKLIFTDYCPSNIRVGGMAVEDAVRGVGTGWDQLISSSISSDIKSPFYGNSNPLKSYYHDNVVWSIIGGIDGQKINRNGPFAPGDTVKVSFTYTYPKLLVKTTILSSPYYPIGTTYSYGKPKDMKAVGFVAIENGNNENYLILNADEQKLWDVTASNKSISKSQMVVYPNPTPGVFTVAIKSGIYRVQLAGLSGAIHMDKSLVSENGFIQIDPNLYNLKSGIYFLQLTASNGENFWSKVIVQN